MISDREIWQASNAMIKRYGEDADVINGVKRLDAAVKKARERDTERGSDARKIAKLREAPDLADLVGR